MWPFQDDINIKDSGLSWTLSILFNKANKVFIHNLIAKRRFPWCCSTSYLPLPACLIANCFKFGTKYCIDGICLIETCYYYDWKIPSSSTSINPYFLILFDRHVNAFKQIKQCVFSSKQGWFKVNAFKHMKQFLCNSQHRKRVIIAILRAVVSLAPKQ